MIQTATWIPPSLCGCKFRITADFTDGSVVDGVSYRHPVPFTITDIRIVNVCADHQPNSLVMPDISGLMEIDKITGLPYQARGYLKHPISNPTQAEILYQFFGFHKGQVHSLPCGCRAYQHFCEKDAMTCKIHPSHTQKCLKHKYDTIDMHRAHEDFKDEIDKGSSSQSGG